MSYRELTSCSKEKKNPSFKKISKCAWIDGSCLGGVLPGLASYAAISVLAESPHPLSCMALGLNTRLSDPRMPGRDSPLYKRSSEQTGRVNGVGSQMQNCHVEHRLGSSLQWQSDFWCLTGY